MLIVGICDGDTSVRIMLSKFIRRYKQETGLNVQILAYANGEKLLLHYPFEMDLIFLEIPFVKMTGIEIAHKIREIDEDVGIVFLTSVFSHVFEAYDVRANNYLIKPLTYTRFLKEMEHARTRRGQNRFFVETNAAGVYKIYTKSIRYIETDEHNTRIHTETDSILCHKHLKEHLEVLFEVYFIRCHTGFIVNLLFFERLEQNELILTTGERIPVSRYRKKEVITRIKNMY